MSRQQIYWLQLARSFQDELASVSPLDSNIRAILDEHMPIIQTMVDESILQFVLLVEYVETYRYIVSQNSAYRDEVQSIFNEFEEVLSEISDINDAHGLFTILVCINHCRYIRNYTLFTDIFYSLPKQNKQLKIGTLNKETLILLRQQRKIFQQGVLKLTKDIQDDAGYVLVLQACQTSPIDIEGMNIAELWQILAAIMSSLQQQVVLFKRTLQALLKEVDAFLKACCRQIDSGIALDYQRLCRRLQFYHCYLQISHDAPLDIASIDLIHTIKTWCLNPGFCENERESPINQVANRLDSSTGLLSQVPLQKDKALFLIDSLACSGFPYLAHDLYYHSLQYLSFSVDTHRSITDILRDAKHLLTQSGVSSSEQAPSQEFSIDQCLVELSNLMATCNKLAVTPNDIVELDALSHSVHNLIDVADGHNAKKFQEICTAIDELIAYERDRGVLSADVLALIEEFCDLIPMIIAMKPEEEHDAERITEFLAQVKNLQDVVSHKDNKNLENETTTPAYYQIDKTLLGIFIEEADDLLLIADRQLKLLCESHDSRDVTHELLRAIHTLKGSALMVTLPVIADTAHLLEDIYQGLQEKKIRLSASLEQLAETTHKHLQSLIEQVKRREPLYRDEELCSQLATVLEQPIETISSETPPDIERKKSLQPEEQIIDSIRLHPDSIEELVYLVGESAQKQRELNATLQETRQFVSDSNLSLFDAIETANDWSDQFTSYCRDLYSDEQLEQGIYKDIVARLSQLNMQLKQMHANLNKSDVEYQIQLQRSLSLLQNQDQVHMKIDQSLMSTRMVPFSYYMQRFLRVVRQTSKNCNKKVTLRMSGQHHIIERFTASRIVPVIDHMIRNAIDHGIESPEERLAVGKNADGHIDISIKREGAYAIIEFSDDGRGIDKIKLHQKALELGLIDRKIEITDTDLVNFILKPGFSTSEQLTQISGRGVGMDVVANEIHQLGGSLDIQSTTGKGTLFKMNIPLTIARSRVVRVRVNRQLFAIPTYRIEEIMRLDSSNNLIRVNSKGDRLLFSESEYPLYTLNTLLGQKRKATAELQSVIIFRLGQSLIALEVDQIDDVSEVTIKPLSPLMKGLVGLAGMALFRNGDLGLVIDLPELISRVEQEHDRAPTIEPEKTTGSILLIDDSATVRARLNQLLCRHGYSVIMAENAKDALAQLSKQMPDLILSDLEMPAMSGLELCFTIKQIARFSSIPFLILTSNQDEANEQKAFSIGVDAYLQKPIDETEIIAVIHAFIQNQIEVWG